MKSKNAEHVQSKFDFKEGNYLCGWFAGSCLMYILLTRMCAISCWMCARCFFSNAKSIINSLNSDASYCRMVVSTFNM